MDPTATRRARAEISGMHCAACAARIERVLGGMPGVVSAAVNLAAETLSVSFDPALTGEAAIAATIADLGFTARFPPDAAVLDLSISGMHCAACSSRIERVVSALPGVASAAVNLASEIGRASCRERV